MATRITFNIYSSLLKDVKELSDSIDKSMKEFTGDDIKTRIGWKIGTVAVTLPDTETKESIRKKLEKSFNSKVKDQNIWLEEVSAYEENDK